MRVSGGVVWGSPGTRSHRTRAPAPHQQCPRVRSRACSRWVRGGSRSEGEVARGAGVLPHTPGGLRGHILGGVAAPQPKLWDLALARKSVNKYLQVREKGWCSGKWGFHPPHQQSSPAGRANGSSIGPLGVQWAKRGALRGCAGGRGGRRSGWAARCRRATHRWRSQLCSLGPRRVRGGAGVRERRGVPRGGFAGQVNTHFSTV